MAFTYHIGIAGMTFQVTSEFSSTAKYCRRFIVGKPGEHKILVNQESIDMERQRYREAGPGVDASLADSPDRFLETVSLLRKLADYVTYYDRILMHGSSIAINGKAYIFTALSGTGKSTHTALLRQLHGDNAVMINDDKPFLHVQDDGVTVYGSPWMGKHGLGANISAPLAGIFFLRRSEQNVLNKISPDEALSLLISQCHRPTDPIAMMNSLGMMDKILSNVPLYDFGCNMDISAAELSSSVMD